ncbi:sigma-70 family RNA polymerase sigma factor [Sphingobacterium alkalisoli]|uniref:Sigma-70 family RNA polymerase sigma factor n=1 Tax=Sphingobacterium alkalisoli TaxID=1874115 RepID=A0A4U0H297_9SPHI|nr:sigma-70 family RNA polymerase sigma factor [Sphingobacterium alkalisoli]TJY65725.1 sigma-70 family RNA polymerase sigma factor [Sphingobacterium alkalisoli]GGH18723.1 RNA polymerase sigma-70 factor [Sphingobacterium alkalisoli]
MDKGDQAEKMLLYRLQEGDEKAFEEIYLLYRKNIILQAYKLLKSRDLVEEVVQDVFTKLWSNRKKIDPNQVFEAYLNRIVRNHIIDLFRKMKRDQMLKDQLILAINESYDHIEPLLFQKENKKLISEALAHLPALQREIFILFKIEQKSYKELMEEFGLTKSSVNSHIYRANLFLKEYLQKHRKEDLILILIWAIFTQK